ncbi:hypothetical protein INS49_000912 [Diaporthe citri]|uniref:uncharacterized protein n=1 Tax=Diaporthe citri TaxID=83186 RepID=UPI001C80EA2D|nr:uncharacterized protein INS49_000912 [Diaporthe citri]KAG6366732.1 hypothetical protein INS49_000912 [Diaporthe citri]
MEPPVARNAPAPATPVMADPAAAAAAEASGAPAAGGGAAPNAAGGTMNALCAQGTILAQGIALNIADQQQELTTANSLATILAANPLITPQENQATPGIATVANAQLTELGLANNLTAQGGDNVAGNMQIVQTLQMDFMGGIMQNMKNMAAAMAACGGMAAPAAAAPQAQPAPAAGGAGGGETAAPKQNATSTSSSSSSGTKGSAGAKGSGGAKAGKFVTTKVGLQNERPNLVSRSAKFVA